MNYINQVIHGDCLEVMGQMPDGCVDLVVTDPPYGINYRSSWKTDMNNKMRKNVASFGKDVFDSRWLSEIYRIAKDNTCLYFFTRWDILYRWKLAAEEAGWHVVQRLIWDKAHWKMGDLRYYGSQTEDVLFCRKGKPNLYWEKRRGDIYRFSSFYLPEGQFDHPTQKPESLIGRFLRDASQEGEVVLDPFLGSGTTAVVAENLGRNWIGIEKEAKYVEIANARIAKERLKRSQLSLEL